MIAVKCSAAAVADSRSAAGDARSSSVYDSHS